jgi:tetratricopeptide (TPR) repeat protein
MTPAISRFALPQFLRGLIWTGVAIVALASIDLSLARLEREEVRADARRHFEAGERLVAAKQFNRAAGEFRSAVSIARDNAEYRMAWAQALFDGEELQGAEARARELLAADQASGEANLLLARIEARDGDVDDAVFSYRRAIYGRWRKNGQRRRTDVRWELTDYLSKNSRGDDLLAELLLLQGESPDDVQVRRRVARIYLKSGFPERAAPLFQLLTQGGAADPETFAELGEAQFQMGNLRLAAASFQTAAQRNPNDTASVKRLMVIERILGLNPMARGISGEQRTRRSLELFQLAVDASQACSETQPMFAESWRSAKAELSDRKVKREPTEADWGMAEAEKLWKAHVAACPRTDTVDEQAVAYLLREMPQ